MIKEEDIEKLISVTRIINSENDFRRIPLEVEQELFQKIRDGKFNEIKISHFDRINTNLGYMAHDTLTQCTYLLVSAVALFSRAAIDGGASPDDCFDLSDALLLASSNCKHIDELSQIYQLSAVMFAKLVHRQKRAMHSSNTERILNYICRNIYSKITLEDLSKHVLLTPNYMCSLFSNEMGISIHNYIQREKIDVSCNLLKYSDRSISDISSYMGFQTQSNFASVFKKWIKMSPTEYREKNYQEVF